TGSTTRTGTASPNAASQASAGTMKATTRNGTGAKTAQPASHAVTRRARGGRTSRARVDAYTKDALRSAPYNVGARIAPRARDTCGVRTASPAGATPIQRQRAKWSP